MKELTDKQKTFCEEYLIDLNATQAAIRAGYSEKTAYSIGQENLTKPEIQKHLQHKMDERSKRTEITADKVLKELARIGFADARDVMKWDKDGVTLIDSEELTDDQAAAVSEVSQTITKEGGSIKLKMFSKERGLELMGKHLKLFTDKVQVEGDFTLNVITGINDSPNTDS